MPFMTKNQTKPKKIYSSQLLTNRSYIRQECIGDGTYGRVYRIEVISEGATEEVTQAAMKKLYLPSDRLQSQTRKKEEQDEVATGKASAPEVDILVKLRGLPGIIQVLDTIVRPEKNRVYLVMELMYTDLETVLQDAQVTWNLSHIKYVLKEILQAVHSCHTHGVIHGDLKPNNLLFNRKGLLKLIDFGMSIEYGEHHASKENKMMNHQIITRMYRPPELLFGAREFDYSVDIWSIGCIFAEMLLKRVYLSGHSDIDQLGKIFHAVGVPTEETWPGVTSLPNYMEFHVSTPPSLPDQFPMLDASGVDLLRSFWTLDPSQRITVSEALLHPFFTHGTKPCSSIELPLPNIPEKQQRSKRSLESTIHSPSENEDELALNQEDCIAIRRRIF